MQKPKVIDEWELIVKNPPAVCWNCDFRNQPQGLCDKYGAAPPAEFAETPGACPEWLREIPF